MDAEQRDDVGADLRATMESMKAPEQPTAEPETPAAREAPPEPNPRPRDEGGRFAPKPKETPAKEDNSTSIAKAPPAKGLAAQPGEASKDSANAPTPEVPRPPPTLKPKTRAAWASLPAEVREELLQREGEVSTTLSRTAQARKMGEAFEKVIAPYRQHIQGDPTQVVGTLLGLAHRLDKGSDDDKAQVVAGLIRSGRVPLERINAYLGEEPPPQQRQQQAPQEFRDPRLDQFVGQMRERMQAQHAKQVAEFALKAPHLDEPMLTPSGQQMLGPDGQPVLVRDVAADFIESYGNRGIALPLEDAYKMAIALHPELSRQQQQAESAKAPPVVTPQARRAAGMPRNEPAVPTAPSGGGSVTDDVRAAIAKLRRP
jgi:hypothetical protein